MLLYRLRNTTTDEIVELTATPPFDVADLVSPGTYAISVVSAEALQTITVPTFSLKNIAEEPVVTKDSGPLTLTVNSGVHAGTYDTDHLNTPLTVAGIQSTPACLALPTVNVTENNATITPGLWAYSGADPGDQTFQHRLNGANIKNDTTLTYTIQPTDDGATFAVEETFGGITVESLEVVLTHIA